MNEEKKQGNGEDTRKLAGHVAAEINKPLQQPNLCTLVKLVLVVTFLRVVYI
jgi:hypothetical protein